MRVAVALLALVGLLALVVADQDGDCVPREVHIALGRDATEMLLSWRTTSSRPCPSRVWLHRASGPAPEARASVAAADAALRARALADASGDRPSTPPNAVGESYLVSNSDMCGSPANERPFARHLHRARLSGLEPGAHYRYAIAGGGGSGGSAAGRMAAAAGATASAATATATATAATAAASEPAIFGFRAAPRPGPDGTVTLALVGDVGWSHHARSKSPGADAVLRAIAADVRTGRVDAVVNVGDVAYADGDVSVWDGFMASIGGRGGAGGGEEDEEHEAGRQQDDGDDGDGRSSSSSTTTTYGALAARAPFMIAAGNHEYSYEEGWDHTDPSGGRPYSPDWGNWGNDSGGECGAMIARRFWMPRSGGGGRTVGSVGVAAQGNGGGDDEEQHPLDFDVFEPPARRRAANANASSSSSSSNNKNSSSNNNSNNNDARALPPFWYAFDYGPVHVTVVSSEHDLEPGSRQRAWLEADLRAVDRCATPWLLLAIHRPMYVVLPHKSNRYVGDHLRAYLEPLLRRYRVDAAVSGHVHVYYRSCPVVASAGGEGGGGGGTDGRCVDERDRDSSAMSRADAARLERAAAAGGSRPLSQHQQQKEASNGGGGGEEDEFGTVHLVVGSGGHKLSGASGSQPRWVRALFDEDYGYLRVQARGGERLVVEFVSPASESDAMGWMEPRVLDRATYEGAAHHEAACRESRERLRLLDGGGGAGAAAAEPPQVAVV